MDAIANLLAVSDAFAKAKRLSESRVSTIVFNDGKRIGKVRDGSDIGARTCQRGMLWFSANWPPDTDWPVGVPRPVPAEVAA